MFQRSSPHRLVERRRRRAAHSGVGAVWGSPAVARMATAAAADLLSADGSIAGKVLVSRVEVAEFAMQLRFPPTVVVKARGHVPALGYSDGEVNVFGVGLPADGVVTAGVFAKPRTGICAQVISSISEDGHIPFDGNAIKAILPSGSQGSLLCLPGDEGHFSRQVDGDRLVRGTGALAKGVGAS